jgi:hypothetical protein
VLSVDTLLHSFQCARLQILAAPSTISTQPFQFAGALPALHWVPNCHSNPIAQRVRRKRQRLPPSLLIENASGLISCLAYNYLAEAFPIKASDNSLAADRGNQLSSFGSLYEIQTFQHRLPKR